jgi:hypothetical protein
MHMEGQILGSRPFEFGSLHTDDSSENDQISSKIDDSEESNIIYLEISHAHL